DSVQQYPGIPIESGFRRPHFPCSSLIPLTGTDHALDLPSPLTRTETMKTCLKWLSMALFALMLSACGYNDFQAKDEAVNAAWSEVINQYQRRADLIP